MTDLAATAARTEITPELCRAARSLLGWSQTRLAERAEISRASIADFESGARVPVRRNRRAITESLMTAGIDFLEEGDSAGAGLRYRYRKLRITGPAVIDLNNYCARLPMHYGGTDILCMLDLDAVNDYYQRRFVNTAAFEEAIAACHEAIRDVAERMVPERIRRGKLHITYKMLRKG